MLLIISLIRPCMRSPSRSESSAHFHQQEIKQFSDSTPQSTQSTTFNSQPQLLSLEVDGYAKDFVHVQRLQQQLRDKGWQLIAHWVGEHQHTEFVSDITTRVWTSQSGQDRLVVHLMKGKKGGYFVDLAANDAADLSNTLTLEKLYDWHGLCIEANPRYYDSLNPRQCQVVQAAVGKKTNDVVQFNFAGGAMGGIAGFDNGGGDATVHTVALGKIFEDLNVPFHIDYMSLDIEGAEGFVFEQFPWPKYVFSILTVERPKESFSSAAMANGYSYICGIGHDQMWFHKSFLIDPWVKQFLKDNNVSVNGQWNQHVSCPTVPDTYIGKYKAVKSDTGVEYYILDN